MLKTDISTLQKTGHFYLGLTPSIDDKSNPAYVRLVRSGQLFDSFDSQSDFIPDAFSFTTQTGAALNTVATSGSITVAGIDSASPISIVGGTYKINSGSYTSSAGTVNNGDTVTLQRISSGSYSTLTTATLTIGGVAGAFGVTTLDANHLFGPHTHHGIGHSYRERQRQAALQLLPFHPTARHRASPFRTA